MSLPRIAVIATTYFPYSHADVIVSRWLEAWPEDKSVGWVPRTQIASLFVDQIPPCDWDKLTESERVRTFNANIDMARSISRQYGVPLYQTIREALCLGGETLSVDGVLLIGEHGDYPLNERGQKLYPRAEFFDQITAVFRESERVVPLFNDKALSWNSEYSCKMATEIRAMNIPFLGGSSLPISGFSQRFVGEEPPEDAFIQEMTLCFGSGPESYGFHSLDWANALLENRSPRGISSIQVYEGEAVWQGLERGDWSRDLFDAMLSQCDLQGSGDFAADCVHATLHRESSRARSEFLLSPVAFTCLHSGGVKVTHLFLKGVTSTFALALRWCDARGSHLFAARNRCGDVDNALLGHFAQLCTQIQEMVLTGVSPVPLERTLLSSLATSTMMALLWKQTSPDHAIVTPHLCVE
jgi:hypothetical protein